MKYRLEKHTKASGFELWVIKKKDWWMPFWEYVDSYIDEHKARFVLLKLRAGAPDETTEIIDQ